jgi:biopolymer transport protein ExbD
MAGKLPGLGQGTDDAIAEINITPFVDIVLVLLIVFMISTPLLMSKTMKVALPRASQNEEAGRVTLSLFVTADGNLLLDKKPIDEAGLKDVIRQLGEAEVPGDAVISADKNVPHGKVIAVVDVLRSNGVREVGFGVLPAPR